MKTTETNTLIKYSFYSSAHVCANFFSSLFVYLLDAYDLFCGSFFISCAMCYYNNKHFQARNIGYLNKCLGYIILQLMIPFNSLFFCLVLLLA